MILGRDGAGGSAPYAGRYPEYGVVARPVSALSRPAVGPPSASARWGLPRSTAPRMVTLVVNSDAPWNTVAGSGVRLYHYGVTPQ